jgi:prepilin-type N-terminal cleavage/methylation domain-containing protein/prepilin-type processing-associated H-X9-DG protein
MLDGSDTRTAQVDWSDPVPAHPESTIGRPRSEIRYPLSPGGFTLVELLVVITIIGILIALLLPAVQAAREAARNAQCKNHLKQIGLAALHHMEAHEHFPSGGWGWSWAGGDPDRGFGLNQYGGWLYNTLPYLEQSALHDMAKGKPDADKFTAAGQRNVTPLSVLHCPSRRRAVTFPNPTWNKWRHIAAERKEVNARTDYCAHASSTHPQDSASKANSEPHNIAQGDSPTYPWKDFSDHTGVVFVRSTVRAAHVRDGMSNTYFAGEKYLSPDNYHSGLDLGDNHVYCMGHNNDVVRWTYYDASSPSTSKTPWQDRPGLDDWSRFGSPHAGGCNLVFCDGSVRSIGYTIDPLIHSYLGNRLDGKPVDASKL